MEDKDYQISLNVKASAEEVFNAINHIDAWWTTDLEGTPNALHNNFTVHFGDTWKTFSVTEFTPGQKINWKVIDCFLPWNADKTEWIGTNVIFDIVASGQLTEIRFQHIGLKESAECFDACSNAWTAYLQNSLINLITTGTGKPNTKRNSKS
ncbi:SRPBCC domain-containing protein [Pedobacter aquatilis]|uniref:SRPBCC family protein n=1 Tax=Pedobacter aquatilis TaxID=351343 RepID=UPI00292FC2C8|nr:SRPBCC domain-containing protein [Pedobacter aquatilis]